MIRFELLKLRRSRRPLSAALALALFLMLMLCGFWLYAKKRFGDEPDFRFTFENQSYFNGLTFTLYAFYFGSLLLLPIFVATEGGALLAGESSSGTLRLLLTRPVSRGRVLLTKALVLVIYATLLTGAFLATCLLLGLFVVGWGELSLYPGVLQMTSTPQHLSQGQALARFALIWPAASVGLCAPAAFSLLCSAWSRGPVNAAGVAVSLYLVMHVVSGVSFFEDLRPLLFTTFLGYWRELFQEHVDGARLARDAAKLAAFSLLFLALAHHRFRTRQER